MKRRFPRLLPPALALWTAFAIAACGKGSSGFEGVWESNFGGSVKLDLQRGNKVVITTLGMDSEGTWEVVGKDQIVVHGRQDMTLTRNEAGELSDGMLGVFHRSKD